MLAGSVAYVLQRALALGTRHDHSSAQALPVVSPTYLPSLPPQSPALIHFPCPPPPPPPPLSFCDAINEISVQEFRLLVLHITASIHDCQEQEHHAMRQKAIPACSTSTSSYMFG